MGYFNDIIEGGKKIFGGSGDDPGFLNQGLYRPENYDIDKKAFQSQPKIDERIDSFARQLNAVYGRQGAQINQSPANEVRSQQMGLSGQLEQASAGQGPSIAQQQLKSATDRNLSQASGFAASQRGGSQGGLAIRAAQNQSASISGQAARDSAILKAQEQMAAREQLAGVLNQTRGTDAGLATSQAQVSQNQAQLNDERSKFLNTGIADMQTNQQNNLMALERLEVDKRRAYEQQKSDNFYKTGQNRGDFISGVGGAVASAFSDKRLKKNVKSGSKASQSMMKNYAFGGTVGAEKPEGSTAEKQKEFYEKLGEAFTTTEDEDEKEKSQNYKNGKKVGGGISSLFTSKGGSSSSAGSVGSESVLSSPGGSSAMAAYANKGGLVKDGKVYMSEGGQVDMEMLMKLAPLAMMAMSDEKKKKNVKLMSGGGVVSGISKVTGDSLKNDVVPAMLSPGEVVLPRTVVNSKDDGKVLDFLDKIKAYEYEYKDPKYGAGKYLSPMAQDLEKSEIGKSMVVDTPEGKMVDYARGAGAYLAAASNLNERLQKLEKGKKRA